MYQDNWPYRDLGAPVRVPGCTGARAARRRRGTGGRCGGRTGGSKQGLSGRSIVHFSRETVHVGMPPVGGKQICPWCAQPGSASVKAGPPDGGWPGVGSIKTGYFENHRCQHGCACRNEERSQGGLRQTPGSRFRTALMSPFATVFGARTRKGGPGLSPPRASGTEEACLG